MDIRTPVSDDGSETGLLPDSDGMDLKGQILALVEEYYHKAHQRKPFQPGKTRINYAGRIFDHQEMVNLVDASLDFWLTSGPYSERFEQAMRTLFKARDFLLVNSGSSANLLMVSTLCSPQIDENLDGSPLKHLSDGDEVITPAVTFPTTLAPILQNRLVPVFVDCEIGTYNIDANLIESAIGPRTKALFLPHTVGLPFDLATVTTLCEEHGLWLLEDGCDALGATYDGRRVGSFGAMSSISFFPAHHVTTGEGGGVVVNDRRVKRTALSMRDWGRDCWCAPGKSNTCEKRFDWQLGELPFGYDHKYIYSNIGYNLKATDLQAAIGLAQLGKLEAFVAARRRNFLRYLTALSEFENYLILPKLDARAEISPFGFPITVREGVSRYRLVRWLEDANIETRLVFGGNILRQPGFLNIPQRVHGSLERSDRIMTDTFFIGVFPGITDDMAEFVIERFAAFFKAV